MRERSLASAKLALSGATQSPPARASDPDLSILKTLDSVEFYSSGPFFSILLETPHPRPLFPRRVRVVLI
jgi:hypothetical protein